jgi:hypothetical protein
MLSMAEYISELFLISKDSAYRRLKGEKQISFNELTKLARRIQYFP